MPHRRLVCATHSPAPSDGGLFQVGIRTSGSRHADKGGDMSGWQIFAWVAIVAITVLRVALVVGILAVVVAIVRGVRAVKPVSTTS